HVPKGERVLTTAHFQDLAKRYLKLQLGGKPVPEDTGPVIHFIGKSFNQSEEDTRRVARAASSRGYKAAKEMVYEAIMQRATDIPLEPPKEQMTVRSRIGGILQPAPPFNRTRGDAVINIFKVLGALDITEKRKPQDGSFSAQVEKRQVDFRLATAGSV